MEFYDNLNLTEDNPEADMYIAPMVGIGFLYQLSQNTSLQFDMGLGYRWYLNNPSVNMLNMAPNSRIDFRMRIKDLLEISLFLFRSLLSTNLLVDFFYVLIFFVRCS